MKLNQVREMMPGREEIFCALFAIKDIFKYIDFQFSMRRYFL